MASACVCECTVPHARDVCCAVLFALLEGLGTLDTFPRVRCIGPPPPLPPHAQRIEAEAVWPECVRGEVLLVLPVRDLANIVLEYARLCAGDRVWGGRKQ